MRGHCRKSCNNALLHFYIVPDIRVNSTKRIKGRELWHAQGEQKYGKDLDGET
jgi:hypothetical protein